jgi:hypothetical protein
MAINPYLIIAYPIITEVIAVREVVSGTILIPKIGSMA